MYAESDLLPLSGLQHLAFCERQWALIHVEQFWSENRLTVEGRHLHERVDEPAGKTRGDLRIVRGMPIHSLRLGLSGRADVVEFHRNRNAEKAVDGGNRQEATDNGGRDGPLAHTRGSERDTRATEWQPFPIEYKRGKPKPGNCDRVQLCAQAICLEEMLGLSIPAGALFYGRTRRRDEVAFDEPLRAETERLAARMHELFRAGVTPRKRYDRRRCDRCSLYDRCLPKTTGPARSVDAYLARALAGVDGSP
jgi:CRISPR-associated exonuclease Cas4